MLLRVLGDLPTTSEQVPGKSCDHTREKVWCGLDRTRVPGLHYDH